MVKSDIPPSREVRLRDHALETETERIAFQIYEGTSEDLVRGIAHLELVIESRQARSVEGLAQLLRHKLLIDGYVVVRDIDEAEAEIHADNVLGFPHRQVDTDDLPPAA